jgi:hypothetical protein
VELNTEDLKALRRAVMRADKQFETTGGGTMHWIRECFLDHLALEGLAVHRIGPSDPELPLDTAAKELCRDCKRQLYLLAGCDYCTEEPE